MSGIIWREKRQSKCKFSQMIGTHSTIIEGKQLIFLNEVVLQKNTAKTKELSNEFKDLITEDNLIY